MVKNHNQTFGEKLGRQNWILTLLVGLSLVLLTAWSVARLFGGFDLPPDSRLNFFMQNVFLKMDLRSTEGIKRAMRGLDPRADVEQVAKVGLSAKSDRVMREYERIAESLRYLLYLDETEGVLFDDLPDASS